MSDHQWAVQQAVYTALRTDSGLIALIGDGNSPERARIYDNVPQGTWDDDDQSFSDYVTVGDDTAVEAGTKTFDAQELTVTLHTWSRYNGRKRCKQIMGAIYTALHNQSLAVSGGTLVNLRWEFADSFLDEDGQTRHGVQRFRFYVTG